MASSGVGRNSGTGVLVKVSHAGMQTQELLGALRSPESKPTSFLSSCGTVRLLDQVVAARCGGHLLVLHGVEHWKFPDGCTVAPQLISMDSRWNSVFPQQTGEEGLRRLRIALRLKKDVEHGPVVVEGSPEPMDHPIHLHADLV